MVNPSRTRFICHQVKQPEDEAALPAFQRRRGSFSRMPSSYCLADTTSPRRCFGHHCIVISRGRCRMVEDCVNVVHRSVDVYGVDSLRLSQHPLDYGPSLVVPDWASQPEYVPLELGVLIRGKDWHTVIIQEPAIYRRHGPGGNRRPHWTSDYRGRPPVSVRQAPPALPNADY